MKELEKVNPMVEKVNAYVQNRFAEYGEKEIKIDSKELHKQLFPDRNTTEGIFKLSQTLKKEMGMEPTGMVNYFRVPVKEDGNTNWQGRTGRTYTFKNPSKCLQ